ncbi:tetratricopeptide repeat protein [Flavihumibacter profundi]|uniref:tetratricopeptide repeat protein n=1 Tax=Flavihumibacter profundi TaxID=2716883 RepID=UPI001CC364F9|nr:tetratricopeptide repeat protein [Flavihumibacter profundi]MBZ5857947.1 tetratricopeptide repeat protein [Flavihumibacter profundi]
MRKMIITLLILFPLAARVQAQNPAIREGNKLYREGRFDDALAAYDKAAKKNPDNLTAAYNRTNTLARKGDKEGAMKGYDQLLANAKDPAIQQRAYYDMGVLHQQQQQLDESITAWKSALKLDPDDKQTRDNLEKAIREKKKQEQEKEQKKDQKQQNDKKEQEKPKPEPQQSKLNQKEVEQLLKALEQREKEVQKKLQQRAASSSQPEKDW